MSAILLSVAAFFSTFVGGLFALRFKTKLHAIMAFTAGVLLGVVSFGFLLFHILEKVIVIHHAHESEYADHKHPHVGVLGALALAGHSFMDGVGIGLGLQVSPAVGLLVAIAVISHDFTDGMNTITLMLSHNNKDKKSKLFLLLDSLTPVLGALSTLFFHLSPIFLVLYLGFFAGFLLYIGASDILPEAHSEHSSFKLIGLTVLGTVLMFIVTRFA